MDSMVTPLEETVTHESVRPEARRLMITAALVVLVHTVVVLVHGAAHRQLNIELSGWAKIYVVGVVGIGPITGLSFLKSSRQRTGALILFLTMMGALAFGLWNHFIARGADHVMHLQAGPWRLPFQVTAGLLACSELAGVVVGLVMLVTLSRQTKAMAHACPD